jgi:hypothetical protein
MPLTPIYVFVRHCQVSSNSVHKVRPVWFDKQRTFENLLATKDDDTFVTVMLDTSGVEPWDHFTSKYDVHVVGNKGGSDAHSFINMIEYVCQRTDIPEDAIVYLLEDDYLHIPGWAHVLREAFDAELAPYVTLYDHADKYSDMYPGLCSQIYATQSCHWRTTPSTTNTYAMRFATLKAYREAHLAFSDTTVGFTFDHQKFMFLGSHGQTLVSSIPGYSTHVESAYLSPVVDWEQVQKDCIKIQ